MKTLSLSVLCALILSTSSVHAQTSSYLVTPATDGSAAVSFSVGYTAGTHFGSATKVDGKLQLSKAPFMISSADITVPLALLTTGNLKRDCHMSEALGIDYTKSIYPGSQVCDGNDTIPADGPNSIAFPTISFSLTSLLDSNSNTPLIAGVDRAVTASGTFTIHGVKQTIQVPLTVTLIAGTPNTLSVKGDFDLLMSNYGVVVRKFLFVTVFDNAHVTLNLLLTEQ